MYISPKATPIGTELVEHYSKYTMKEILATLAEAAAVKPEHDAVMEEAGQLVELEFVWSRLAPHLQPLNDVYRSIDDNEPVIETKMSYGVEPYPVKTWQAQIAKARRQIKQMRKAIASVPQVA